MRRIETDYLVVGGGVAGTGFVDTLLRRSDADFVIADRRHAPGGHWLDAYPFVRLHQPSAYFGVESRVLGQDRIDEHGINAGFYERSTAAEICAYYQAVLEQDLLPSGRVRFLGQTDYRGMDADGHHLLSLLTGEETVVKVRRKLVDATLTCSEIPLRHALPFSVDPAARVIPPNGLVNLDFPASGFTVIGAGKTAMDTCNWLLDCGVDPDRIRWIRPRESWLFLREWFQPLQLVAQYLQMNVHWLEAAAEAHDGRGFARGLEERGVCTRIDPRIEPDIHRGATISHPEIDALRTVERVVRQGKVRHVGTHRVTLEGGDIPTTPTEVHVDCTAPGVPFGPSDPVFQEGRIAVEYVTVGIAPWSAATIAAVESLGSDDDDKNRLAPPAAFNGEVDQLLSWVHGGLRGTIARAQHPEIAAWNEACRLNPARVPADRRDDPAVVAAYARIFGAVGPAMRNLAARTSGAGVAQA
jgi:hypothetical protein